MSEFKVNHVLEGYTSPSSKRYVLPLMREMGHFTLFFLPDSCYIWRTDAAFFAREKELRIQEGEGGTILSMSVKKLFFMVMSWFLIKII